MWPWNKNRELKEMILKQQGEIDKLRNLLYARTRVSYGPRETLLVVDAIDEICEHLGLKFNYGNHRVLRPGWKLVAKEDESEE